MHGDVAHGDGDLEALLLRPPLAALLQLCGVAGARVHPRAERRQLLHDGVPDALAPAGDQRLNAYLYRSGEQLVKLLALGLLKIWYVHIYTSEI